MTPLALQRWHDCVRTRASDPLNDLLADDVVFYSPVVHAPQVGKALVTHYLASAIAVLGTDSFRYTKQIIDDRVAVLEFETTIPPILVNGVDIITWNAAGKVIEFKVMIRPLKAIHVVQEHMAAMLAKRASARTPQDSG